MTTATMTEGGTAAGGRPGMPEREVVVSVREPAATAAFCLILTAPGCGPLPGWSPGAHIDVLLPGGLIRQYSLCGDPADRASWRICVQREPDSRGGSAWLAEQARPGTVLRVRGPRNNFALVPAPRYRFLAGGIGITPLLPMIAEVSAAGRPWRLLYGGRTRASMAFTGELSGYGGAVTLAPQSEAGLLDLDSYLAAPQAGEAVYCCGPEPLIEAAEQRCASWPAGSLHVERFAADPREAASRDRDLAFEVTCSRSGLTLTVPPGQSILAAVREAGLDVDFSCTEGICGTCETAVLGGVPDHRDSLLTAQEREAGDTMMICVSRCRAGPLVLDL